MSPAARPLRARLGVLHGFTTRAGGVSEGPYSGLNLGLSSGDAPDRVEENRDLLLDGLGFRREQVLALHQVHGSRVVGGAPSWFEEEADAAVTDDPGTLLVVSVADCLPILLHDPGSGAVGAAHCGWRGTALGLVADVVREMQQRYGTRPEEVRAAIGPGIAGACYQVGPEVAERFFEAGFPTEVVAPDAGSPGRFRLDLNAANRWLLEGAGLSPSNVDDLALCTHCDAARFYSYRRDAGATGRHWAFISPLPPH